MKRLTLIAMAAAIFAASCTLTMTPPTLSASVDLESFQRSFMTTFDIMNGSAIQSERALTPFYTATPASSAKATVPVFGTDSYALPANGSSGPVTLSNYPEAGQTSIWTAETTGTANVYLVKVTTSFASGDVRDNQAEWYYINSADRAWTTADAVCDSSGATNPKYRAKNRLTYDDGSYQDEVIVDTGTYNDHDGFAAFGIEGSLAYPGAFLPQTDLNASYSSVVVYTRTYTDSPTYSFWSGNRVLTIVGVRYYTENLNATNTVVTGSMIVFEKAVTSLYSLGGDFLNAYSSLFLPTISGQPNQAMLALTVIRQAATYKVATYANHGSYTLSYSDPSNTRDTRTMTRVVNIPAQQDNYVTRINNEAALITNAYDTLWIPSGNDPEIINLATATVVNVKTTNQTVTTDGSAPVTIATNSPVAELGTLYVNVTEGTLPDILSNNDIADDLTGTGSTVQFSGSQGFMLPGNASAYATLKGTLQAWIYVNSVTDTPGLVHAGIKSDFSDELWSLQFMGTNNTPTFGIVAQSPYKYDLVTSSKKLKTGLWYYVVATWDVGAKLMTIYVDGVATGSTTLKNVSTSSTFATNPPIVIGSQFYDSTKILSGYYGFNGKINGVLIDNRVWSASEIKAFYTANKDKTVSW